MRVGDADGHGHYGILDPDEAGRLVCHECGHAYDHSPGTTTPGTAQKRRVVPAGRALSCSPTRSRMWGLAAHGSAVTVRVVSSRMTWRRWPRCWTRKRTAGSPAGSAGSRTTVGPSVRRPAKDRMTMSMVPAMAPRWMPSWVVPPWVSSRSAARDSRRVAPTRAGSRRAVAAAWRDRRYVRGHG